MSDLSTLIAQAVAEAIAQAVPSESGVVVEAAPKAKATKATKAAAKKRVTKPKSGLVTCGIAWKLLGADPAFEPKDANRAATAPQLWRLNSDGLLAEALSVAS